MWAFEQASKLQDVFRACLTPEHAGSFEAATDDRLASGFDYAASNEVSLAAEVAVAGALNVGGEVGNLPACGFLALLIEARGGGEQPVGLVEDALDVASFEFGCPNGLLGGAKFPVAKERTSEIAEVFDGVIEVEYLNGGREKEAGVFPDPCGTVTQEDDDLGKRESAPDGFGAELFSAGAAVSHGADVAGGVGIAQRVSILIGGGLGEDTAEFGFAGASGAVGLFAFPAGEFLGAEGYTGAVIFKIEDGDGFGIFWRRESRQRFG